ncbi:UNVERIFIED_CONTAM: hypothetical protein Slati_2450500 [Sesamum latifolium]|uniref:Reverse transcriptase domain-containing protein n=1 Tax=Sesamum latifolium TaxID=2727402 RepID=A0AAW2WD45_9LAMI
MEVLSLIVQQLIDQDGGFSYHWRCGAMQLFQLGFADDLLLFSMADTSSVLVFKHALTAFADLSGLHANLHKSHLILSRSAAPLRDELLATLDFQEGHLPLRYLGLPLLASRLTIADCQPILRRLMIVLKDGMALYCHLLDRTGTGMAETGPITGMATPIIFIGLEMVLPSPYGMTPGTNRAHLFSSSPWDRDTLLFRIQHSCAQSFGMEVGTGHPSLTWRASILRTLFPPSMRDGIPETHEHLFFTCSFAADCLQAVRGDVLCRWPSNNWPLIIQWASRRWRSKHVVNASFQALLAALVYHLWQERNRRIFQHSTQTPIDIARTVVSDIRDLIICKQLPRTVSTRGLYRLWRIPWPVEGEANT